MKDKTGGPKYPEMETITVDKMSSTTVANHGMTLLDHFACESMKAIIPKILELEIKDQLLNPAPETIARMSYNITEAMMKERERFMEKEENEDSVEKTADQKNQMKGKA